MPRNYYLIAVIVYFCSNLTIFFASTCESTTQYKLVYPYPPGYTPVVLAKLPRVLDLEYFHPHHLDLPPAMKDITTAPPLPKAPPTQDFSKLGFVYITVLGLADQVVPHTGSWRPLATALNYLFCIAPIVYMAFQAQPASPVGVQLDSGMGRDSMSTISNDLSLLPKTVFDQETRNKQMPRRNCHQAIPGPDCDHLHLNQNTAALTTFPDLPKLDLAGFRKGMIMINALFHAHPKSFIDKPRRL
ncbi:hypothetical protein DSO57_1022314 [Entomophthora muscae]|uniref:Uncharacterized protein n=1 Tax=Entomophthora muscae TaxID=34485 RepID=A0ACC2SG67_9FUNG|nr:hypothetical protein DSO57_1022314 [Entomophthora muscae]